MLHNLPRANMPFGHRIQLPGCLKTFHHWTEIGTETVEPLLFGGRGIHRAVRRNDRVQYIPFLDLGNGLTIGSQDHSGTDYTWEFPVLANYKFSLFKTSSLG